MFTPAFFTSEMWDGRFWPGYEPSLAFGVLTTTWLDSAGDPFAVQALDYVVKNSSNGIVTSGTATTNANGVLSVNVPEVYIGQKLLIHVENVSSSMVTTGKFHGTQVATVA